MRTEVGTQLGKNGFYFAFIVLLSTVVFADEIIEPSGLTGTYSTTSGMIETSNSCPSWITALHRNSTDNYKDDYLTIELDGCQVLEYEVYTMTQDAATGFLAELEENDLFIVWDEDEGHGGNTDFEFTGEVVVVDENRCDSIPVMGSCDYARVSSTNEEVINWVLYRVKSAGTLTVNDTGLNEHDAIHLQRNYVNFEKTDNVEDCVSPTEEFEYTIKWNNTSSDDFSDVYIVDWLPDEVDFKDFVSATAYQAAVADPNIVFALTDDEGLSDITLPAGQSVRVYLTKETTNENVYFFSLEADISDPNLGWIDNAEYNPNDPNSSTAEILASPRDSFFDYYGPGYTQEEGIQFYAVSLGNTMEDGDLASFVYTATQPGYVVLTLVNYDDNSATLEEIVIRQTDPNDPNYVPQEPNEPQGAPVSASSIDGEYDPNTHSITWQIGDIAAGTNGSVSFTATVNYTAEPGIEITNVAEMISGEQIIARATKETSICCWDTTEPNIIFVDKTATGNNNGTSWMDAYKDLQDALYRAENTACENVDTIYIAQGTYRPGDNTNDSFEIPDGFSVYGSFKSGGCDFSLRNPKQYETILTGRIDETHRNESVVKMGNNSLLDGVIVQDSKQQGILIEDVDAEIVNCIIKDNLQYGLYADNSDVEIRWCRVENNGWDGIDHLGNSKSILVENCHVNDNSQHGLYLEDSASIIKNTVICRNGAEDVSYFGIRLKNPSAVPFLHNNTLAYNYNAAVAYTDDDPNYVNMPNILNCIIWYNNEAGNGEQFAGWKVVPQYSCIYDPNDPNGVSEAIDTNNHNFSHKPDFAYPYSDDPNVFINVHLATNPYSFCKDRGNPNLPYANQKDMDNEDRAADGVVDVGADEITCDDVYNPLDWNADGLVNFVEWNKFSQIWMSHDPNDPAVLDPNSPENDPNSPYYIKPSQLAAWYPDGWKFNLSTDGDSAYSIDTADLLVFLDESPWCWAACWRTYIQEMQQMNMMMGGAEGMTDSLQGESVLMETSSIQTVSEPLVVQRAESAPPEKSIKDQISDLQKTIQLLDSLWAEDSGLRDEIQVSDWQRFIGDVCNSLTELQKNDTITQDKVED